MVRFALIKALDCMLTYYKVIYSPCYLRFSRLNKRQVALKRFVDDIANEVVESRLVSSLSRIFSLMTVFDMPVDLIMRTAGESKES
jgi:hypothetical protein